MISNTDNHNDSIVRAVEALIALQTVLRESRDMALRDLDESRRREAMMAEETRRLRARLAQYETGAQ